MAGTNSFYSTCCLGEPWCSEWDCCDKENTEPQEKQPVSTEDFEPLKKKTKEDLLLKKERFALPVCTDAMKKLCEGYTPANTTKKHTVGVACVSAVAGTAY